MELRKLRKLGREWQETLGLVDWKMTFHFTKNSVSAEVAADEMACCHMKPDTKTAKIVLKTLEVSPCDEMGAPNDLEETLVHEILHPFFVPFQGQNDLALEQAINTMAKALVTMKRKR
jgi:hypothetical protein